MIDIMQFVFAYVLGVGSGFGVALFIGHKKEAEKKEKESWKEVEESV